jgi:hypothetical protein
LNTNLKNFELDLKEKPSGNILHSNIIKGEQPQSNLHSNKIQPLPLPQTQPHLKIFMKKASIQDDLEKLKQRREERKKKFDDDKKIKIEIQNNPDYYGKLDLEYENLIKLKKCQMEKKNIEDVIN